ncbi:MAG TPA: PilZ domain-containing protein [Nitrospiraceae bacterium]|jgi:hypothetical protein|nr:PilZ domain-containing protein [Nitrospiraceae bacterium]HXT68083.1 PilZ domain-containing protein [Nitrospiraceae bacterium]
MATQVNPVECRSSERIALQCSIIVATGVQTGEGRVLNVSKSGCLVEAPILIKAGDYLQMRLFLPNTDLSMCVSVAIVQWALGFQFGVEFIEVDEKHRTRLNHFIATGKDPWTLAL